MKAIVENSCLLPALDNSVIPYDIETISAFCERYYGETDTMHFPFGEMGIIPDDAGEILDLAVEGKSTKEGYTKKLDWDKLAELCQKLFGWSRDETESKYVRSSTGKKREFNLIKLRSEFQGTLAKEKERAKKGLGPLDEKVIQGTAAAYLLYILATVIFPSSAGNRVNANLIQLLHPLDEVHEYSWATAVVSHLNTELRKASRSHTAQINGNLALLQVIKHFFCKGSLFH